MKNREVICMGYKYCPYMEVADTTIEREKWYCDLKGEYVVYDTYNRFCYCSSYNDYLDCPKYKHEDKRRRERGLPELKRR